MQVIVISVDAMITSDLEVLREDNSLKILLKEASWVEEMIPTFPTLTYPCHVSIMTGCTPKKHGFIHNEEFQPFEKQPEWKGEFSKIQTKTMVQIAEEAGYRTALVSWPVSIGALATYVLPEIWPEKSYDEELKFYRRNSKNLTDLLERQLKNFHTFHGEALDEFSTAIAIDILKEKDPDFLFLHYAALDCSRHNKGVESDKNLEALGFISNQIRKIYEAKRDEETMLILLSDHGQIACKRVFYLNEVFRRLGYISLENKSWKMYAHTSALASYIYVNDFSESEALKVLESIEEEYEGVIEGIYPTPLVTDKYSISTSAVFVLKAGKGWYLSSAFSPELCTDSKVGDFNLASHGGFPGEGPKPPFVIIGKQASGVHLKEARLIDEAKTIMKLFDLDMPSAEGVCLTELLMGGLKK